MEFFLCNRLKIAAKPTMHQDSAVSKAFLDLKTLKPKIWVLNPENYLILRRHRSLGQTTKHLWSNFAPQKPWKYKQLWRSDTSCSLKKISVHFELQSNFIEITPRHERSPDIGCIFSEQLFLRTPLGGFFWS